MADVRSTGAEIKYLYCTTTTVSEASHKQYVYHEILEVEDGSTRMKVSMMVNSHTTLVRMTYACDAPRRSSLV